MILFGINLQNPADKFKKMEIAWTEIIINIAILIQNLTWYKFQQESIAYSLA